LIQDGIALREEEDGGQEKKSLSKSLHQVALTSYVSHHSRWHALRASA
jgi:hypothetical protein